MTKSIQTIQLIGNICKLKISNTYFSKRFFTSLFVLLFCSYNMIAQVSVTASAGTASASYTTLALALAEVNNGTHQGVIDFAVSAGSEVAPASGLTINASGVGSASYTALNIVASSYTVTAGTGAATPSSAIPDGIIKLLGADNVKLEGLTLVDNNVANPTTMEYGIGLFKVNGTNGCQNNTIINNTISLKIINNATGIAPMFDGSVGILLINSTGATATTAISTSASSGSNSNNTINNNTVSFCNIGIGLSGFAATNIANADVNNTIGGTTVGATGNTVSNFGGTGGATNPAAGIRLLNQWEYTVNNNIVNNNTGASTNHIVANRGIFCATQASASFTINNNTVTMKNGAITAQISCIENVLSGIGAAPLSNTGNINNNTITNCAVLAGTTTGTFNGIVSNGLAPFILNINNNTITNNTSAAVSDSTVLIANYTGVGAYTQGEINIKENTINSLSFTGATAYSGVFTGIRNNLTATAANSFKPLLNISSNDITGITYATTSTGINYFVLSSGAGTATQFYSKVRISLNNIHDLTLNHSGVNSLITSGYGGASVSFNADSNKMVNINFTGATAGALNCNFHNAGGHLSGVPIRITNNKISNITSIAGAGLFNGHLSNQPSASPFPNLIMAFDTVQNVSFKTSGSFFSIFAQNMGEGGSGTISPSINNNFVSGNRCNSATMWGINALTLSNATLPLTINNNIIQNDTNTATSANNNGIQLVTGTPAGGVRIFNNNISGLINPNATGGLMIGLVQTNNGTSSSIYNNFMSNFQELVIPSTLFSPIIGINLIGLGTNDIHHNTFRLDSAGFAYTRSVGMTGIAWGSTAGAVNKINNNIINLKSVGSASNGVVALRRALAGTANTAPATTGIVMNNNIYSTPLVSSMVNTYLYAEGTTSVTLVNGYNISGLTNNLATNIKNDPAFNTSCGLYKAFIGSGRETGTYNEDNLSAGSLPNTYVPSGSSYADAGGTPITTPVVINTDYIGASRSATTPDMGALEFIGTPLDATPPSIVYTPIPNTVCQGNPTLSVAITDASGVNAIAGTKPRLWFKKSTELNVLPATNTSADNGWKFVEALNTVSPFIFNLNYALLNTGASIFDTIQYFVGAQDLSTSVNVGINLGTYPAGYCPITVALDAAAFGVTATNKFILLPPPSIVTSIANPQFICFNGSTLLSLGGDVVTGASYQWQQSVNGGPFSDIPTATSSTFLVSSITATRTYRVKLACSGVPLSLTPASTPVTVTVNAPILTSAANAVRCGNGAVNLTGVAGAGSTLYWYENAIGDTAIGSGSPFVYPPTGALAPNTYTKYVSAGSVCNGFNMGKTPANYSFNVTTTDYGHVFDVLSPSGITIDSADFYGYDAVAGTTGTVTVQLKNNLGTVLKTYGPYTVNNYTIGANNGPLPPATRIGFGASCNGIVVPPGTGYRLVVSAMTGTSLMYYTGTAAVVGYPHDANGAGIAKITGGWQGLASATTSNGCFNWKISARCETSRIPVTITVNVPPAITLAGSAVGNVCQNTSYTITATSANAGYTYAWTPSTFIGNPLVINPTNSVIYTATASDANGCVAVSTLAVNTFPPPPFIGLSNSNPAVCPNGSSTLAVIDSNALGNLPVNTGYCVPTVAVTGQTSDFINNFTITGPSGLLINNLNSGDGTAPNFDFFFYNNTIAPIFPSGLPNLVPGATYTLTAQAGVTFPQGMALYLDYDRNTTFSASELLITFPPSSTVNTFIFTIPLTASAGQTRLRVQCRWNNIPLLTETCVMPGFGEAEDYLVKIGYPNSPATGYAWASTPAVTITPNNTATVVAAPIPSSTSFTLTASDANGCTVTKTTLVGVGPIDCGTITSSKPQACAGDCVTLTANPSLGSTPYTYVWKNSLGTIVGLTKTISPCPSVTSTYSVTVYSSAPCVDSCNTSYTQIINPLPVVSIVNAIGGPIRICGTNATSVTINSLGATTYTIAPSTGVAPNTTSTTGTFTITTAPSNTYTVIGADAVGCTNTASAFVNYYPNYNLYMTASPANVCPGGASTLCTTDTNAGVCAPPTTYLPVTHTTAGPCIDTVLIGTYLDASGTSCSLPSYTANIASSVANVIIGGNISITNTIDPSGYSAVWIDFNQNGIFETSEYTSLVVNGNASSVLIPVPTTILPGCSRIRFRSRSSSISSTESAGTFADGETQDYTITFITANYTSIVSYQWAQPFPNGANTLGTPLTNQCASASNITAPLNVYRVTVTDANGCSKQSTVAVNVQPLVCSAITANGATTVCQNSTRVLTANRTGGGFPFTYSWTSSATGATVLSTSQNFSATNPTTGSITYTVVVTDACSPTGTCSATIILSVLPQPTYTVTGITQLCTNTPTNILCSPTTLNYISTYPAPAGLTGFNPFTFTPGVSTIFTITGVDAAGCSKTSTVNIVYSPPFTVTAIGNPTGIGPCGGTVTLTTNDTVSGSNNLPTVGNYCTTNAHPLNSYAVLTSVQFGDINNVSGNGSSAIVPTYYPPTPVTTTTVVAGGTYNFSANLGVVPPNTNSPNGSISIWIDFNRNNVWDASEWYQPLGTAGPGTNFVTNFPIVIPSTAQPGLTKMLIRTRGAFNPNGAGDACSIFGSGEGEIYDIRIISAPFYPIVTYNWTPQPTSPTTGQTVTASPTGTSTIYTVTATNSVGCSTTSTTNISVGPVNCGLITANFPTICSGLPDSLTANPTLGGTPYTYSWVDSATGTNVGSTKVIVVNPTNLTSSNTFATYSVTVTDNCGLSCVTKITLTVKPNPVIAITNSLGTAAICATGNATLTAVPVFANAVWAPGTWTVGASNIVVTNPTTTNIYTVTVTGANACTNTATSQVSYSPPFNTYPTATPPFIGCPDSVMFSTVDTILTSGSQMPLFPNTYGTASSTSLQDDDIAGFNIVGTTLNNISPCGSTGGGANVAWGLPASSAFQYANYTGTVAPPTLVAGQSYPVNMLLTNCNIGSFSMGVAVFVDYNRSSSWNVGDTAFQSPGITLAPVGVNTPFNFNITIPANASPGLTLLRVRVNESNAGTTISPTSASTWGETEDYLVNIIGYTQATNNVYSWTPPAPGIPKVGNTVKFWVPTAGTYTVTSTNSLGCTTSKTISIAVSPLACAPITTTPAGKDSICSGTTVILNASTTGGGVPSYVWSGPAGSIITSPNSASTPVTAFNTTSAIITATFTVTTTDACGSSCTKTFTLRVLPNPQVFITASTNSICYAGSVILNAAASSAVSTIQNPSGYTWSGSNVATLSTITGNSTVGTPLAVGDSLYIITVTDANQCKGVSSTIVNFSPSYTIGASATPSTIGVCGGFVILNAIGANIATGSQAPPLQITYGIASSTSLQDDDIAGFNIVGTTLNNASGCGITGGGANPAWGLPASAAFQYANYTGTVSPPTLVAGQSYPINMLLTNCNTGTFSMGTAVFIDYDRSGSWTAGDTAFQSAGTTSAPPGINTPFNFNITIPANATPGLTLMRVRVNEFFNGTTISPTSASAFGETEDYLVNIISAPPVPITTFTWNDNQANATLIYGITGAVDSAVLTTGTCYTLTVANAYGCATTASVCVSQVPFALTSVSNISNTAALGRCAGKCDTVKVKYNGGGAPYAITFTPDSNVTKYNDSLWIVCPIATQTYSIVVADACNTSFSTTATVYINPAPILTAPASNNICNGAGNVLIGPATSLTCNTLVWTWPGGTNTNTQFSTALSTTTTFTVTCTDFFGCTNTATQVAYVTYPHSINISASPAIACYNTSDTLSFTDSTLLVGSIIPPTGYCTPGVTSNTANDHITNVTFANINNSTGASTCSGCPIGYSGLFNSPVANLTCNTNYTLTIKVADGSVQEFATAWIDWNANGIFDANEAYSPSLTLVGGVYTGSIVVTPPASAVIGTMRMRVRSRPLSAPVGPCVAYFEGETEDYLVKVSCAGSSNNISWSWASTPANVVAPNANPVVTAQLTANTLYTLTVTDVSGCTYTKTKSVLVNPAINIATNLFNLKCYNQDEGAIKIIATGGTPGYTYYIIDSATSIATTPGLQDYLFFLKASTYYVSVTDSIGCQVFDTVSLTRPDSFYAVIQASSSSCFGGASGKTVGISYGGTAPYNYTWLDANLIAWPFTFSQGAPINIADTAYGLLPQCYRLLVTDANGCYLSPIFDPFVDFCITQPSAPLKVNATIIDSIKCFGQNTAKVQLLATGGTPGFKFSSDSGVTYQQSGLFTGLSAGTYYFFVKDTSNICFDDTMIVITEPTQIIQTFTDTNANCFGQSGSIVLTSTGGTGALADSINGIVYPLASYLAGTYIVKTTDANNCTVDTTIVITQPDELILTVSDIALPCFGQKDTIAVAIAGGVNPITTLIDSLPRNTVGYGVGDHIITITDSNNCFKIDTITITQPTEITRVITTANATCNGIGQLGSVTVVSSGGTGALEDSVNNAPLLANYQGGASYTVITTDSVGCSTSEIFTIGAPAAITITTSSVSPTCYGGLGSIIVSASGGNGGIILTIGTDTLVQNTVLPYSGGAYLIVAKDDSSCTKQQVVVVANPDSIKQIITTSNPTCFDGLGTLQLVSSGGTGALIDSINGSAINTITNFPSATYVVKTTDSVGCFKEKTIVITNPAEIIITVTINSAKCFGDSSFVNVTSVGGTGPLRDSISDGNTIWGDTNTAGYTAQYLAPGNYIITATDASGCISLTEIIIKSAPSILASNFTVINANCSNEFGQITWTTSGGSGNYYATVTPNNDTITSPYDTLIGGVYVITTTDGNGCTYVSTLSVDNIPNAIAVTPTVVNPLCGTGNTGTISVAILGGTPGYDTLIDNALPALSYPLGQHEIVVIDSKGCTDTTLVNIIAAGTFGMQSTANVTTLCAGDSVTLNFTSNNTTLTGTWSDGTTGPQPINGQPFKIFVTTTFTITATDGTCSETATITIVVNQSDFGVVASVPVIATSCNVSTATFNGGYNSTLYPGLLLTYTWSNGTSTPLNGSTNIVTNTSVFTVTGTDGTCSQTATISVAPLPPTVLVITPNAVSPACGSGTTGTISPTVTGGLAPYTILINTLPLATSYAIGNFTIVVTDSLGCKDSINTAIISAASYGLVASASASSVCLDSSVTLSYTMNVLPSSAPIWTSTLAGAQPTTSVPYTLTGSTIFTVTASVGACSETATVAVNANNLGVSGSQVVITTCTDTSAILTGSATATGVSFTWSNGILTPLNSDTFSLPATSIYTVTGTQGTCKQTATVIAFVGTPSLSITANASATTTCVNTTTILYGSSATANVVYTWSNSVIDSLPIVLAVSNVYTVTGTIGSCVATATIALTANGDSTHLSQASLLNAASLSGNACSPPTMTPDGLTVSYSDPSCDLIATVADANGGNMLGNVNACVFVNATTPLWNNQPFAARTYTITPTNQGPANVTLYYTNDDISDYNTYITASSSTFPQFNRPNATPLNGDIITNATITKLDGGGLGLGSVSAVIPIFLTYDAPNMRWYGTFAVASFSSFFLHTTNPANTPLSVNLLSFTGRKAGTTDVLNWVTSTEKDNQSFILKHSTDGNTFTPIATVATKAINGNSNAPLAYQSINTKPVIGHNYYMLEQVAINGSITNSNIVDIVWTVDGAQVNVYPNPAHNELHIDVNINKNTMATIKVLDVTGKLVKQVEIELAKGQNSNTIDLGEIANGVYMLKVSDGKGLNYSQQFRKQ